MLWWGTYYDGWDYWFDQVIKGVDIASTLWTPITAMGDWEVVEADERWDWGLTFSDKTYSKLNRILECLCSSWWNTCKNRRQSKRMRSYS